MAPDPVDATDGLCLQGRPARTLSYDFVNQEGTNPVWMTIDIDTGVVGTRSDDTVYQFVPAAQAGWHTVDAAAGLWQKWADNSGTVTGPLMTLSEVAAANTGLNVVRTYLRLGMGDSYNGTGNGTVGWVDKATIGGVTYDFVVGAPTVTSVSPNQGTQGQTLIGVVISGTNLSGATVIDFGLNITVSNPVVNGDGTQITADLLIGAGAATGLRDVSVTTPGGMGTATGAFTVNAAGPPAAPTLTLPANGATVTDTSVTFEWTRVTVATAYKLIVNTTNNLYAPGRKTDVMLGDVITYTATGYPADGTKYYWWVVAYNASGVNSNYTQVIANGFSFTNGATVGTPTLTLPANAGTASGSSVRFEWSTATGATDYKLIVNTTNNLYATGRKTALMVGNVNFYVDSGYPAIGTKYYWWVVAYDAIGNHSDYTQVIANGFSFTNTNAAIGTPTLTLPANAGTASGSSVTFEWTRVTGATAYKLIVNTTNNLYAGGRKTDVVLGDVITYMATGYPANGTKYYWWVVAYDASGNHSDYTQVIANGCSFTNTA